MQFENTSMNSSLENSLMSPLLEYDELLLNALPRTFGGATTTDYPFYLATFLSAANESSLLGEEGSPLLAEGGAGHAGRDFALDFLNLSESGGSVTKIVVHNVTRKILNASSNLNFQNNVIVPLYAVIFLLSVIGNSLVILTLAQNKRMRTVTNVYLLNLAVSDLLLGVFCMPFTLVGQILRNFIFGKIMCKLIPYFQAVSVSVAVWTLVAISLERYFAICRPLSSRRWQTQFHAYKMIGLVWLLSFLSNSPLLFVQQLQPLRGDTAKCREVWPSNSTERTYVIFLDIALLVLPLVSMVLAYSLIVSKLWRGLRREMRHSSCQKFQAVKSSSLNNENGTLMLPNSDTATCSTLNAQLNSHKNRVIHTATPMSKNGSNTNNGKHRKKSIMKKTKTNAAGGNKPRTEVVKFWLFKEFVQVRPDATKGPVSPLNSRSHHFKTQSQVRLNRDTSDCESNHSGGSKEDVQMVEEQNYKFSRHAIRSTYMDKSIEAKKKVIRMLFVIIVEFFVCWAPIHILNTVYLYSPSFVYTNVSSNGIALVQLMAYISSCCNPITYCFMNRRFRQSFLGIFNCYKWRMYCCCSTKDETVIPHTFGLKHGNYQMGAPCNSDASGNDSTVFAGRGGTRSEIVVLEAEDRV